MNSIQTGIIKLEDLPENIILVGLKEDSKKRITKQIRNNYKIKDFCKKINIKLHKFYNFENNEKITLKLFNKITRELKIKNIRKHIELLGTKRGNIYIKNPKIPFRFNTREGAKFISALLFDGGMDRENKPHYGNKNKNQRKEILKCALNIFGDINSREIDINRNNYFIRFPKTMGIILEFCFNIKKGQKVQTNPKIPDFIFNLNKECQYEFIKQAFDDDGTPFSGQRIINIANTTDITNNRNNKIPSNLITDLKKLIENVKIETNPIKQDKIVIKKTAYRRKGPFYRQTWGFSITGRENLLKFYKNIGFNLKYKQERLKQILDSYKCFQLRKGEIKKIAIEKAKLLQEKQGYFTNPQLAKEIKRSYRQTARLTQQLLKENTIKLVKPRTATGFGSEQARFKLFEYETRK